MEIYDASVQDYVISPVLHVNPEELLIPIIILPLLEIQWHYPICDLTDSLQTDLLHIDLNRSLHRLLLQSYCLRVWRNVQIKTHQSDCSF